MAFLDYSPSHKYLYPRLHRERHWTSNDLITAHPVSSVSEQKSMPGMNGRGSYPRIEFGGAVTPLGTPWGSAIKFSSLAGTGDYFLESDQNDTPSTQVNLLDVTRSFSVVFRSQKANNGTHQPFICGAATDGWYVQWQNSTPAGWNAVFTKQSGGTLTAYTANDVGETFWWTMVGRMDLTDGTGDWFRNMVDSTDPGPTFNQCQLPDAATSGTPKASDAGVEWTMESFRVYNRYITHEEAAMYSADLA